jgi:hypothetical protein
LLEQVAGTQELLRVGAAFAVAREHRVLIASADEEHPDHDERPRQADRFGKNVRKPSVLSEPSSRIRHRHSSHREPQRTPFADRRRTVGAIAPA